MSIENRPKIKNRKQTKEQKNNKKKAMSHLKFGGREEKGMLKPQRVKLLDEDVGKKMRESKKRVTWTFLFGGDPSMDKRSRLLIHSIVSERKIMFNGNTIFEKVARATQGDGADCRSGSNHAWAHGAFVAVNKEEK